MGSPLGPTLANIFMGYKLKLFLLSKIIYYTSGMLMIVLCWSEARKISMNFQYFK